MSDDGTCDICGRPLPTQRDADEIAPGHGEEWCWRQWHGGVCMGEPVDWRQLFLAEAEARAAAEGACDCAESEVARLREQVAEGERKLGTARALLPIQDGRPVSQGALNALLSQRDTAWDQLDEERATSARLRGLLWEAIEGLRVIAEQRAEVERLNVEISEIEENYDARGTQIQDFVSAWGCSADFVDEMLNDSNVGLGGAIGWAREALASALGLPDRGGDLLGLADRAASEIERLKKDQDLLRDVVRDRDAVVRERDEALADWRGVTEQWKHALGKLDEMTEEIATLRAALGTLPDAQVLSPLSVSPAEPMLICPSCQCAWPGLMPGRDDTVTCSCGRLLGCAMRDR